MTIYKEQLTTYNYFEFAEMEQTNKDLFENCILAVTDYCKDHYYDLEDILIVRVTKNMYAVTGITNEWLPIEVNSYMRLFDEHAYALQDTALTLKLVSE